MSFCIYDFHSRVFERIGDAAFQLTYNIIFVRKRSAEIEIRFFAGNSEFSESSVCLKIFALWSMAFDGMQPRFRHTPPSSFFL